MPGTLLAMGLNSPRISTGARGLRSKVSIVASPPLRNRMISETPSLPAEASLASKPGSVTPRPNGAATPIRSRLRRERPSQKAAGCIGRLLGSLSSRRTRADRSRRAGPQVWQARVAAKSVLQSQAGARHFGPQLHRRQSNCAEAADFGPSGFGLRSGLLCWPAVRGGCPLWLRDAVQSAVRAQVQFAVGGHQPGIEQAWLADRVGGELLELRLGGQHEGAALAGQVVQPAVSQQRR